MPERADAIATHPRHPVRYPDPIFAHTYSIRYGVNGAPLPMLGMLSIANYAEISFGGPK